MVLVDAIYGDGLRGSSLGFIAAPVAFLWSGPSVYDDRGVAGDIPELVEPDPVYHFCPRLDVRVSRCAGQCPATAAFPLDFTGVCRRPFMFLDYGRSTPGKFGFLSPIFLADDEWFHRSHDADRFELSAGRLSVSGCGYCSHGHRGVCRVVAEPFFWHNSRFVSGFHPVYGF